jgi:hypothetical protein
MRKLVAGAVVLVFLLGCGGLSDPGEDTSNAGPQEIVTATSSVTAAPSSTPPAGPIAAFADGTYEVGTGAGQVPAGTYRATVPADSPVCYWERLKGFGGFGDVITNGTGQKGAPMVVTIAPTDKGFKTQGCGTWK